MAKVKSSGLRNYVGRLAGSIYYIDKGRNISREVAAQVSNPKTQAQMVQRVRLANLVNFYKANKEWMLKYAFEKLVGLQSVYNAFVSLNLRPTAVPLTKENAAAGVVMPDLMRVTKGSLPSIKQTIAPKSTYMAILGVEVNPEKTTVAGLTAALLKNGWKVGDQLSIIRVKYQSVRPCIVMSNEIILSAEDNSPLENYGIDIDDDGNITSNLTSDDTEFTTGHAGVFVHSRRVDGKVLVSSEILNLDDAAKQSMNAARSTRAYELAIASYGYEAEPFLDPAQDTLSEKHTISVVQSDAGTITGGGTYNYGTEVTISATPKSGFTFNGWAPPFNGKPNPFTLQVVEDATVEAYYIQTE